MAVILTDQLTKHFTVDNELIVALDSLSISIDQGKIVGLLGPNGAGKTTSIRVLASIYQPTAGHAEINSLDTVANSLEVRSQIGIAHERPSFYQRLSGRRNLQFYAELYDVPANQIHKRIDALATDFDLSDAIDQPVGSYSKGMRQKLSVAKALIHDPAILILDEPWSGLSPGATRDLRNKISQLGKMGKTILITTHNLSQAEQVVDELIIISHGKLVATGTPAQLRKKYHLSSQLIIKMQDNPQINLEPIERLEVVLSATQQGSHLLFDVIDFSQTPEIIAELVKLNIPIREVRENIPSLEQIYLDLVEE